MSLFPLEGSWIMVKKVAPIENAPEPLSIYFAEFEKAYLERPFERIMRYGWKKHFYQGNMEYLIKMYGQYKAGKTDAMEDEQIKILKDLEENNFECYLTSKAKIQTNKGDVFLLDHEFVLVDDLNPYMEQADNEHVTVNFYEGEIEFPQKIQDAIFYIRQRGIKYVDALKMMAGSINKPKVFWLSFHEEYQKMFIRRLKL